MRSTANNKDDYRSRINDLEGQLDTYKSREREMSDKLDSFKGKLEHATYSMSEMRPEDLRQSGGKGSNKKSFSKQRE